MFPTIGTSGAHSRTAEKELLVFSLTPEYSAIASLKEGWKYFYQKELAERTSLELPPFWHIARVVLRHQNQSKALTAAESCKKAIKSSCKKNDSLKIYGPLVEWPFKKGGRFHYGLVVKAQHEDLLREVLKKSFYKFKKSSAKIAITIT